MAGVDTEDEETKLRQTLFHPDELDQCTEALFRFITEYNEIIQLLFFVIGMATNIDHMAKIANDALGTVDPTLLSRPLDPNRDAEATFKRVRYFSQQLSRNMVIGMANNHQIRSNAHPIFGAACRAKKERPPILSFRSCLGRKISFHRIAFSIVETLRSSRERWLFLTY